MDARYEQPLARGDDVAVAGGRREADGGGGRLDAGEPAPADPGVTSSTTAGAGDPHLGGARDRPGALERPRGSRRDSRGYSSAKRSSQTSDCTPVSPTFSRTSSFAPSRRAGTGSVASTRNGCLPSKVAWPTGTPFTRTRTWWSPTVSASDPPWSANERRAAGRRRVETTERERHAARDAARDRLPEPGVGSLEEAGLVEPVPLEGRAAGRTGGRRARGRGSDLGHGQPVGRAHELPGDLAREGQRAGSLVGEEEERAAGTEHGAGRLHPERDRDALPLQAQLRGGNPPLPRGEELLETDRVEPPLGRVQLGQHVAEERPLARGSSAYRPRPGLRGVAPVEGQPHDEAPRQDELLAVCVVPDGHELDDGALRLALEHGARETRLLARQVAAGDRGQRRSPPDRADGPVPRHLDLRAAEGRRPEPRRSHAGRRPRRRRSARDGPPRRPPAPAAPAAPGRAGPGTRRSRARRPGRRPGVTHRVEPAGAELDDRAPGAAGQDPEGRRLRLAVGRARRGRRGSRRGEHPRGAGPGRGRPPARAAPAPAALAGRGRLGPGHRGDGAVEGGHRARVHVLEAVEVTHPVREAAVHPRVRRAERRGAETRDELRRDPLPGPAGRERAMQVEAQVVELGRRPPGEGHLAVAGCSLERHQGHRGRGPELVGAHVPRARAHLGVDVDPVHERLEARPPVDGHRGRLEVEVAVPRRPRS